MRYWQTLPKDIFLATYKTQLTNEQINQIKEEKSKNIYVILKDDQQTIIEYTTDPQKMIENLQNTDIKANQ